MTISEIQNTLNRILKYNKNLDEKNLMFLLTASDWSDSDIKDAMLLFKNKNLDMSIKEEDVAVYEDVVEEKVAEVTPIVEAPPEEQPKEEMAVKETIEVVDNNLKEEINIVDIKNEEVVKEEIKEDISPEVFYPSHFKDNFSEVLVPEVITESVLVLGGADELLPSAEITSDHLLSSGINEKSIGEAVEVGKPLDVQLQVAEEISHEVLREDKSKNFEPRYSLVQNTDNHEIKKEEIRKILEEKVPTSLPENLPLKPFESSPHIMKFSDYAGSFHKEVEKKNDLVTTNTVVTESRSKYRLIPKKESSLVWLASSFLVAILLLLLLL